MSIDWDMLPGRFQSEKNLTKMDMQAVARAVTIIANADRMNQVRDYFDSLNRTPLCISIGPGLDERICSYMCMISRRTKLEEETARVRAASQENVSRERIIFYATEVEAIPRFVRLCESLPVDQAWRVAMADD